MDDRHKDLQIIDFSSISARRFQNWTLRSIVLEQWLFKDPNLTALLPFKPYTWKDDDSSTFLNSLQQYYDSQLKEEVDMQPIKYNALGITLSKVVGQHQAFFLIQTVLGTLIVLALLWFMLADKF